uniref:RNA-directed DNA polymerase, eukaryota n=1 Tax=Tanacetum cinerariifolium TaxID=118510 RepID=A0A699HFD2_TANCI|nr:RNA-directed DNA polymerase, eukaryota [Tanacetum cinerariifolium]
MGDHNRFRHQSKEDQAYSISKTVFSLISLITFVLGTFGRFKRDHKPKQPGTFNKKDTFTGVLKTGVPCTMPSVLDDSCLKERNFSMSFMGKVKEVSSIPNLYILLLKEGFKSIKITYLGGLWVLIKLDFQDSIEKLCNHTSVGSRFSSIKLTSKVHWICAKELDAWVPKFFSESDLYSSDDDTTDLDERCQKRVKEHMNILDDNEIEKEDPFNIYELLQKKKNGVASISKELDPTYPLGFTPANATHKNGKDITSVNDQVKPIPSNNFYSFCNIDILSGGSILDVMDDLVKAKKGWINTLCSKHKINFVALQETKMKSMDLFTIKALWGNFSFDHAVSHSIDNSRGILCVWDPNMFIKEHVSSLNYFFVIIGLIDIPLGGYSYTWSYKSASKMKYGPTPFRIFTPGSKWKGLINVEDSWHSVDVVDSNSLIRMKKKLQCLKSAMKTWVKDSESKKNEAKSYVQDKLIEVDKYIDQAGGNDEILQQRVTLTKDLHEINSIDVLELSQKAKFSKPSSPRVSIDGVFPNRLNLEQVEEFKSLISQDEIKKAVWDCGINKSSGPDGFTFGFFQKYWNVLNQDIVAAIHQFFDSGKFPPSCNSSFIALIPNIQDAKIVKYFQPISLIGSIYKSITKILANHLSIVMPDLINDVNAMIFKVDFEKDFDYVRWDYLDDVLRSFGFGDKRRKWISGCLNSARGSVLINGSPTTEFQFHKGLSQGDPLSPFLFILVMESLHISFARVLESDLYKGISINNSLMISHLFCADDAVFVGKWDISNIKVIVNVLKCFFMASGLKINLYKSKLMGIRVSKVDINSAAQMVGCSTFPLLFIILGLKLVLLCLDLIRGRKSLKKFVLDYQNGSSKLYLLVNFFNGAEKIKRKMVWIRWENILDLKNNGGLGVASFYSTNRALLFKWIWWVFNDGSSLWSRFIKAIHGVRGAMDTQSVPTRGSIWLDLVHEFSFLKLKGIDLLALLKRKLGNGENILFWEDI